MLSEPWTPQEAVPSGNLPRGRHFPEPSASSWKAEQVSAGGVGAPSVPPLSLDLIASVGRVPAQALPHPSWLGHLASRSLTKMDTVIGPVLWELNET